MKKIVLVLCVLFLGPNLSNATHLMGGDIGISIDVNGNHILEHINFRDTLGIPAYAQTEFSAFKWNSTTSTWASVLVPTGMNLNMPMDSLNSGGLLLGIPYGIQFYKYRSVAGLIDSIFNLNGAGKYLFFTEDCCRNLAILNMSAPGSEKLVISCEYTYDPNPTASKQSPEFLAIPIIYGPVNQAWVYNPLPFDSDGDSLSWVLNTPYGDFSASSLDTCAGYALPNATTTGPFTLNSFTGQVTWTPSMVGNFVASFKITEYDNGQEIGSVIRDMQYVVVPDSNSNGPQAIPEFVTVTNYNNNTQNSYAYLYYSANTPLSFTVGADDPVNPNDILSMQAFCELLNNNVSNAAFGFVQTGIGNGINGTFTWTPTVNDTKDYILVVRANDGSFSKDFTIVLRNNTAPQGLNEMDTHLLQLSIFPNPANSGEQIGLQLNAVESVHNLDLQIVDISGKLVATQHLTNIVNGNNNFILDAKLQSGFYFAHLQDRDSNRKQSIKFIVR